MASGTCQIYSTAITGQAWRFGPLMSDEVIHVKLSLNYTHFGNNPGSCVCV